MFKQLISILIGTVFITVSNACSCRPIDKNVAYCNAKFVGVIKVYKAGQRCGAGNACYLIKVLDKIRCEPPSNQPIILRTADTSAACGITLNEGDTYFVATDPTSAFYIGLYQCQFYENWTGFSESEIEEKLNAYRQIKC